MLKVRISVPKTASIGDIIEIKTLVSHPMETGFRRDLNGNKIPRNILKTFNCTYNGHNVFNAEFFPAIAANPYFTFFLKVIDEGDIVFNWTDQDGQTTQEIRKLEIQHEEAPNDNKAQHNEG